MNLFFRLLRTIIWNLIKREKAGYLDETVLRFRVWITDQDAFQHMNNSRYLSIADLSVIDTLMKTRQAYSMRRHGVIPVVVYKHVSLFRMLKFPQAYEVRTRITGWHGHYTFFQHDFMRRGKLHAQAMTVGRLVSTRGKNPTVEEAIVQLGWENVPESPPITDEQRRIVETLEHTKAQSNEMAEAAQ